MVLAIICFGVILMVKAETRFIISGVILTSWSAISFFNAFNKKGIAEKSLALTDERDRFIVLKSSNTTLKISNYLMGSTCFISLCLYGISKNTVFFIISATLCCCLVAMFLIMLFADIYYNKHE